MSGVVHLLSASITSALAIKPSTVYVLRVENTQTRNVWHIRRCFSEFCELREKMIVLIDGQSGGASANATASSSASSSAASSPAAATTAAAKDAYHDTPSAKTKATMRVLALHPSKSTNSPRRGSLSGIQERYPYLYAKFPRRQFFGSRTKKVIEQRTLGLNQFLQEALWFVREVKMQHKIAIYFGLMTQLEAFFDCAAHASSPVALRQYHSAPVGPFPVPFITPEIRVAAKNAEIARAVAARGFWTASGTTQSNQDDASDEEDDDYEERKVLKKTISCFMDHEVAERRLHHTGSHYSAMQTRASDKDQGLTSADAWAARIEIAGICPKAALQRRNSNNQAMLLRQQSGLQTKEQRPRTMEQTTHSMETAALRANVYAKMSDTVLPSRPECMT